MKLKKNDNVKVLAGKDKGKSGRILKVDRENERVVVQSVNLVKKTMKKRNQQDQGGIKEIEAPIHVSNVAYLLKNGDTTRIGMKIDENGKKVRFAKKTGEVI
ncbi:MAG: 50S ribosomal protein L24 [Sphaerochaetaceae bacterium]|jgi:large subunit ribosomal protein L24|nr:50S ribosomal protein L24 [Sphaerochaetaceae bacterium]NLO59757.1 50S ribosomal protein L24 [Spirochaetales bacterium]MDD2405194.1 50S ribosomal protein L24 [Sphaerochaetaceae bacterium]MDD3670576.1 50S ribosomal protein L24 [Sphaerochaetaceae bacterium]MDD4258834.1 50S ribosomal protein L24 [Sphaerochaetaceae bacterium]